MCVQYINHLTLNEMEIVYDAFTAKSFEWVEHLFPRYLAPVLIERKGKRELVPMHFGLIPHFEKNEKPKMVFHNARVETLKEKPSFQQPFLKQRCLIPMNSFLEYVDSDEINSKTKLPKKKIIQFSSKQHQLLTAAGIWSLWRNPSSNEVSANFSIITTEPPPFISESGHDRCPLFLDPSGFNEWLNPMNSEYEKLESILTHHQLRVSDYFSMPRAAN